MSEKTHCDSCDKVIEPAVQHLTLKVGLATGERSVEEEDPRDFCDRCVNDNALLRALWKEAIE